MMRWLCVLLLLAGCDSLKDVPCDQCAKYGAVCNPKTKMCEKGLVLDMAMPGAAQDMAMSAAADMTSVDLMPPPMCTQATVVSDCSDATKPVCDVSGTCRACSSSTDDAVCQMRSQATPRCQTSGSNAGQCVQCRAATQGSDCAAATPICGSDGTCRKCRAHGECPSLGMWSDGTPSQGVCVFDNVNGLTAGSCAAASQVAFVDNLGGGIGGCKTNGMTHDGSTPAKAYCDVQDAVLGSKGIILVRGTAHSYGNSGGTPVSIARSLSIIGPGGKGVTPSASIEGFATGSDVTVNGSNITVVLDGLELASTDTNGLACGTTGGTVIARRLNIHSATQTGVSATNCDLTLDASYVEGNQAGGIAMTGSRYTLTNDIIAGNTNGYGVSITTGKSNSVFAFDTIASNSSGAATPAGVLCGSATTIQASIVYMNTESPGVSATQFTGSCTLQNVVTGADAFANTIMGAPAFGTDYHLDVTTPASKTQNEMYCVNKVAAPGTPNADHDVDFTARPKGTSATPYDIGAQEAE